MTELGVVPRGRTLLKPNVVSAGPIFEHAFTRPEFIEGVLLALRDRDQGAMTELAVGERSGITIPTRYAFEAAGYEPMLRRTGARAYYFEEEPQVEIPLTHASRLRDFVFTPAPVAAADFFVNCPKFKAHPWTTVTFSLKAYIGIQDDRHRLIDHDHGLNQKIRDLQYVVQPQLICIDAIVAGEARMLTPRPKRLNLILMGNNQVAFDSVCSHVMGVDPQSVEHIRRVAEEGFGPLDLDAIEIGGDVPLEEARARAQGFQVGLERVEKYFEGSHITAYAGPPPESERTSYCWGGCPGAIEEAIEILRAYDAQCDEKLPRLHVVFGAYQGPIAAGPGEKVIFIGDCAEYEGQIGDKLVQIRNKYQPRSTRDPRTAKHDDIYAKMARVMKKLHTTRHDQVVRFEGCPVSVAEQVLALAELGGLDNPYFDRRNAWQFTKGYLSWRAATTAKRLRGEPYQRSGPAARGAARVEEDPRRDG